MMEIVLPSEEYTHETAPDGRIITRCTMRQIVLHTIGLNDSGSSRHRPYTRHGRKFYRPWRNYFSTYIEAMSMAIAALREKQERDAIIRDIKADMKPDDTYSVALVLELLGDKPAHGPCFPGQSAHKGGEQHE